MIIRPASVADAPEIIAFWNPLIRDTAITFNPAEKSVTDLTRMIADKQALGQGFLVAELNGEIVGFASYGQFRAGPGYLHSMELTVILAAPARGFGAGRALVSALEEQARRAGVHVMFGCVSSENPDGVAFHRALGYQQVAYLPEVGFKFGRWMGLHMMQKIL